MAYNELSKNINNDNLAETLVLTKQKAQEGTEVTKYMKSVKGRASYQLNKGVGHFRSRSGNYVISDRRIN